MHLDVVQLLTRNSIHVLDPKKATHLRRRRRSVYVSVSLHKKIRAVKSAKREITIGSLCAAWKAPGDVRDISNWDIGIVYTTGIVRSAKAPGRIFQIMFSETFCRSTWYFESDVIDPREFNLAHYEEK